MKRDNSDTLNLRREWFLAGPLCLISLIAASCAPSIQTIPWEPLGVPEGEAVSVLVTDPHNPSTLYCGSLTGELFHSSNQGRKWTLKGTVPGAPRIYALLIHPDDERKIYVASASGLYHSTDGGSSFQQLPMITGQTSQPPCVSIAFDPWQPAIMYGGSKGSGIFGSTNGGRTWNSINGNLDMKEVSSGTVEEIVVHPRQPGLLYAILSTSGALRSTDTGASWTKITERFHASGTRIRHIVVNPDNPALMCIGTEGGDIYRSENAGEKWELSMQGTGYSPVVNFAREKDGPILYAGTATGVVKSDNFGGTWTSAGTQFPRIPAAVATVPDSQGTAFYVYGPGAGIRHIRENASEWVRSDSGLTGPMAISDIILTNNGSKVIVCSGSSVFSIDGSSWSSLSEGLPGSRVTAVAADRGTDSLLYAATMSGPYYSVDEGKNWLPLGKSMAGTEFLFMSANPAIGNRLIGMTDGGMMVSTDKGTSWNRTKPSFRGYEIRSMTFHPANAGVVGAGTANNGALISTDGGIHWDESTYGLQGNEILSVTFSGSDQAVYRAWGSDGKAYRSTNKGIEWTVASTPWENITHFIISADVNTSSSLIALVDRKKLYYSANGGDEWTLLPVVPPPAPIMSLAWNEKTRTLFAGSTGDGLFRIVLKKEIDKALKK